MNEFLVKLIANSNNGGGNPYHDEDGKFTFAPVNSFAKLGFESTAPHGSSISKKHPLQAAAKFRNADGFYTLMNDKQLEAMALYHDGFEQMEKCFKNTINGGEKIKKEGKEIAEKAEKMKRLINGYSKSSDSSSKAKEYYNDIIKSDIKMFGLDPAKLKRRKQLLEKALKSADINPEKNFYEKAITAYSLLSSGVNTLKYINENLDSNLRHFSNKDIDEYTSKYGF